MELKCLSGESVSMYAFSAWCLKHRVFHPVNGSYEILNNNDKIKGDPAHGEFSHAVTYRVTIDTAKVL